MRLINYWILPVIWSVENLFNTLFCGNYVILWDKYYYVWFVPIFTVNITKDEDATFSIVFTILVHDDFNAFCSAKYANITRDRGSLKSEASLPKHLTL